MSFSVFRFLLIACVINLSVGYYHRNGGNGETVKHVICANRKHGDGNGKTEKDGIINFESDGNNIFGINNSHFGDDGLGIDDCLIGNGLHGERHVRNGGLRDWQNGNIRLRINDWHVGNGLLGNIHIDNGGVNVQINDWHIGNGLFSDLYLENDSFNDWQNLNVGSIINDWHVDNGLLDDWHVGNGGVSD